jgi:hypothetical protein
MAAGLGFKDFVTGEVLTAADVDGYLMQGVWVFASAAARDAAVTSPQEGNFAYLKDTNVTTYYTGSAWANLDTTGMTNPMTTTGDTIYSSSGSTPARLGIGTAGQVLTVNSGATAPEWKTASSGGMTLISTTTLSGASVTLSSIPATYKNLQIIIRNWLPATDNQIVYCRFNGDSGANRYNVQNFGANGFDIAFNRTEFYFDPGGDNGTSQAIHYINIPDYTNTTTWKMVTAHAVTNNATTTTKINYGNTIGYYNQTAAISSIDIFSGSGNMTSGTCLLYGVS